MSSHVPRSVNSKQIIPTASGWHLNPASRWRERPERLAWTIILISFGIFAVLLFTIPYSIRYFIHHYSVSQPARLEPTLGTLFLYPNCNSEAMAVTELRDDIAEGSCIVAADDSSTQGTLGLIQSEDNGELLGSLQLYPGTELRIERIRQPFFSRSQDPYYVRLFLEKGQIRVFSNSGDNRPLRVELVTAHGQTILDAGTYWLSTNPIRTDITVRSGQAELIHTDTDSPLQIATGSHAHMTLDSPPQEAESEGQNLILNGNFQEPWPVDVNIGNGEVQFIERDGRGVAYFVRQGEDNYHTEIGITQEIEADVHVYDYLSLQLDVKLLHQSLAGAGYIGTEFPLRVQLNYTDQYGKELEWGQGFYYRDPKLDDNPDNDNWPILHDPIPPFTWHHYESPNLIELLKDTPPARIHSIRIYASGWNYQSIVSEVYLLAR